MISDSSGTMGPKDLPLRAYLSRVFDHGAEDVNVRRRSGLQQTLGSGVD